MRFGKGLSLLPANSEGSSELVIRTSQETQLRPLPG